MDIYNVYLGEGYGSLRNPITFRDYEKHPYGSWEKNVAKGSYYQQNKTYNKINNAVQSRDHSSAAGHGKSKDKCPFCKEQKKRPLVSYMRKRENKKHNESICEEEGEEEEEEEEAEQQQQQQQQHVVEQSHKAALLKSQ